MAGVAAPWLPCFSNAGSNGIKQEDRVIFFIPRIWKMSRSSGME
jgi:hypothetical protein